MLSRTAKLIHRRPAIVAFLSEPVKGKPPKVGGYPFASGSESKNSLSHRGKCVPCANRCVPRFELVRSLFRIAVFLVANWCVPNCEIFRSDILIKNLKQKSLKKPENTAFMLVYMPAQKPQLHGF